MSKKVTKMCREHFKRWLWTDDSYCVVCRVAELEKTVAWLRTQLNVAGEIRMAGRRLLNKQIAEIDAKNATLRDVVIEYMLGHGVDSVCTTLPCGTCARAHAVLENRNENPKNTQAD